MAKWKNTYSELDSTARGNDQIEIISSTIFLLTLVLGRFEVFVLKFFRRSFKEESYRRNLTACRTVVKVLLEGLIIKVRIVGETSRQLYSKLTYFYLDRFSKLQFLQNTSLIFSHPNLLDFNLKFESVPFNRTDITSTQLVIKSITQHFLPDFWPKLLADSWFLASE